MAGPRSVILSIAIVSLSVGAPARGAIAAPGGPFPCRGGWTNANAPGTGTPSTLYGVAVVPSSNPDIWAVGQRNGGGRTLAEHWDGKSWSIVPTPSPNPLGNNVLYGVGGASADDVWAVGAGSQTGVPLVLHWDGASWSEVPTPKPEPNGGFFLDVAVLSADDVWAVGLAYGLVEDESSTLTEHWDGTAWSVVPSPSLYSNDFFSSVSADAESDVWAIGLSTVERWDGSTWNVVPSPSGTFFLSDVEAFGIDDVWTAGWSYAPGTQPVFEHWDGSVWMDVPGPTIPDYGQIMGLARAASGHLWAVGTQNSGVLIERWDGSSWHVANAPSPHGPSPAEMQDVAVGSSGVAVSVGTTATNNGNPIVERTCHH
jgi:hypothetical protein